MSSTSEDGGLWGTGRCHVTRFRVVSEDPSARREEEPLGVMLWSEVQALVEGQGGHRVHYDVADVPEPGGTIMRYWMIDVP